MVREIPAMKNENTLSALRLIRSDGVGPMTYLRLVERFGSASAALNALPNMKKPLTPANLNEIDAEYKALQKMGGSFLVKGENNYPELLQPIDDAPPVLSALGNLDILTKPMLAIVGARNASANGRRLAAQIARDLGDQGFVIVSGLARGIDAAAHEASLNTGTVAVLANGVDVVYPPENQKLYDAIRERGVLLSENALGTQPTSSLFPRRNRIISGLCRGVIVIEAAAKSGSLITTRDALDQGREVFAVPGSPLDPRSTGPNQLIKSGHAHLIESAQDILDILGGLRTLLPDIKESEEETVEHQTSALTNDQTKQAVLNCLGTTPCTIDQIAFTTQIPVAKILAMLMEMELSGMLQRLPGDRVALI
jgi:DNA processing protein